MSTLERILLALASPLFLAATKKTVKKAAKKPAKKAPAKKKPAKKKPAAKKAPMMPMSEPAPAGPPEAMPAAPTMTPKP